MTRLHVEMSRLRAFVLKHCEASGSAFYCPLPRPIYIGSIQLIF
jgi:hypothetical protein